MTDHLASPGDDAVELASRYLDGDLSVDERAAAASDPDVMAWVERFGGIQAALREPVEVDADQRDAAVAAALAAATTAGEAAPPPGRDELAAARARRAGRMGRWLGAAAAVVGLAIGGAVLAANSGGDGDDSADETQLQSAAVEVAPATTEAGLDQESAEDRTAAAADAPSPAMATTAEAGDSAASTAAGGDFATDPSARDEDTGGGSATESTAAPAETTAAATTVQAAEAPTTPESYNTPSDLQPLATAVPVTVPDGTDAPCADDATGELVDDEVLYAGQPAAVYRDVQGRTLTVWALSTCEVLVAYVYPAG
jgi:hypothetical protein